VNETFLTYLWLFSKSTFCFRSSLTSHHGHLQVLLRRHFFWNSTRSGNLAFTLLADISSLSSIRKYLRKNHSTSNSFPYSIKKLLFQLGCSILPKRHFISAWCAVLIPPSTISRLIKIFLKLSLSFDKHLLGVSITRSHSQRDFSSICAVDNFGFFTCWFWSLISYSNQSSSTTSPPHFFSLTRHISFSYLCHNPFHI
jgi:hypothetical protein